RKPLLLLTTPMLPQLIYEMWRQRDRPAPMPRLRPLNSNAVSSRLFERLFDRQPASIEIDVLPAQRQQLIAACPGAQRQRGEHVERMAAQCFEQLSRPIRLQHLSFLIWRSRRLNQYVHPNAGERVSAHIGSARGCAR